MPSAAGETVLLPPPFPGREATRRRGPAQPHPPAPQSHCPGARVSRGEGGVSRAGTLGRGRDARVRGHPQHRTAAASCSTQGRRIAPSPLPAPRRAPPLRPLGCPATATVKCSPAPGAGSSRSLIGCGSGWLRPSGQALSRGSLEGGDPSWARLPAGTRSFCFANPEIDSSKERRERKRLQQGEGRGSAGRVP